MDTFKVGDTIDGKYTVTRILGQGGMGIVLEASRPGLPKPVAIKVLLQAYQTKPGIAARFAREARVVDSLQTEHVARVPPWWHVQWRRTNGVRLPIPG